MIVNAKWFNLRKEYRETKEHYSDWVDVVDVSAPDLDVTITLELPHKVADITAYLRGSEELEEKLAESKKRQDGEQFQLTIAEEKLK